MSIPMALLLSVCLLGMWVADYIRMPELWLSLLLTQCLVILNSGLLCALLYRAKATAHFSLLPAVLYIAAMGVFPYLRLHWQPQLIPAILLFFLLTTRDVSDPHEANGLIFFSSLLLCLTALLVPDAVWCIAFLWVVVLLQGAFSVRAVVASLLAVALVAIYYVLAMYVGWVDMWDTSVLIERQWFAHLLPAALTTAIIILLLAFLLVTSGAFRRSSYDLVSTRMLLYHVVMFGLLAAPLILFTSAQPDYWVMLPFTLSATVGIYMMQKESETRGVTLLLYLIGAVGLYLWLSFSL